MTGPFGWNKQHLFIINSIKTTTKSNHPAFCSIDDQHPNVSSNTILGTPKHPGRSNHKRLLIARSESIGYRIGHQGQHISSNNDIQTRYRNEQRAEKKEKKKVYAHSKLCSRSSWPNGTLKKSTNTRQTMTTEILFWYFASTVRPMYLCI